jgi:integrase
VRGPHVEKRTWTYKGKPRISDWYYLVFYVKTSRGAKRVYRRTSPPTDQKRLALEQLHRALARGDAETPAGNATVAGIVGAYLTHLEAHSPTTHRAKRYWLEHWRDGYGHLRAGAFRLAHVDAAVSAMREAGHADGTIGDQLGLLRAAFRRARREGTIQAHPVCELEIGRRFQSPERHVTWTRDEFEKISAELPGWAARLFALLLTTGLRVGDGLALRWDAILEDRILLRQQKTGDDVAVPLTAAAREVIAQLPRRDGAEFVFESPVKRGDRSEKMSPRKPYLMRTLYRALAEARETTKIRGKTIHDLRRTYATRLLNGHVSPALIAALLGQRTTRLVGKYTHAEFETLRAAAALGALPPQPAALVAAVTGRHAAISSDIARKRKEPAHRRLSS